MKLLFFVRALAGIAGGAEKVLSEVASELSRRGHEIELASHDAPGTRDFYPVEPAIVRHRLGPARLPHIPAIRALLRNSRPQAAIGMMYSAYMPLALAAVRSGVPIVASEHTAFDHYRSKPLLSLLLRATTPRFEAITVPSEKVRQGYPRAIAERMTVIPNPVSIAAGQRPPKGKRKLLLAVGNLRTEKGHRTLVEAFAAVAGDYPQWDLRIAGEGPERAGLERQIERLGLRSRVQLAGFVADVAAEYAAADLFVMPSAYESFGLATAEALSRGVPAIGFAECPGTNDLIVDGVNGLLVRGADRPAALAEGLARLMGDEAVRKRLGSAGPASVEQFAVGPVADRWEQLLRSVVSD